MSIYLTGTPITNPLLFPPSKCKGFTRISEDSSEIAFLLVENYTMTAYSASSDRNGIFGQFHSFDFLFTAGASFRDGCGEEIWGWYLPSGVGGYVKW